MPHYKLIYSFLISLQTEWSAPLSYTTCFADKRNDVSQYYNLHVVNNFTSMTIAGMHVNMIYMKTSGKKITMNGN